MNSGTVAKRRLSVTILVAAFAAAASVQVLAQGGDASAEHEAHHHEPAPALPSSDVLGDILVDFSLVDGDGRIMSDDDFRGRYMLMGYGFTRCTDVCPLMAANMAMALRATEQDAVGIFISVDTERDDPERTHAYASAFSERMIGLGGTHDQVAAAARNFKVSFAVTKTQSGYTVQHTSHLFLVGPDGELLDVFALNTNPNLIAEAMSR